MFHTRVAASLKTPRQAAPHWRQAIRLDPLRLDYHVRYARFLLDHGAEKAAEAALREAVKSFAPHPELQRLLGLSLYAQGETEAALDAFLKAIDLAPDEEGLYASLETLLPPPAPRLAEVRERIERYEARQPGQPLAPYLLALCSGPDSREALLRKALSIDATFWPALFELHKVHQERGEGAEGRRLLEEVVRLHPGYPPAWYALAQAYAAAGERDKARRARARHHELTAAAPARP
jgi:tetratricopeptide (TPR) repeat protein